MGRILENERVADMSKILVIAGIISIIVSVILGIAAGTFPGFLTAAAGGVASGIVFFALSTILDNQQAILNGLQRLDKPAKQKTTCPKCGGQYDGDMHSCPYCGYRE